MLKKATLIGASMGRFPHAGSSPLPLGAVNPRVVDDKSRVVKDNPRVVKDNPRVVKDNSRVYRTALAGNARSTKSQKCTSTLNTLNTVSRNKNAGKAR